ncbi:MAG: CBS domain-containing protein [Solirubrobacteraceae bacterium]
MGAPLLVVDAAQDGSAAQTELQKRGLEGAPVVDDNGRYIGVLDREANERKLVPEAAAGKIADPTVPSIRPEEDLEAGLQALMNAGRDWVPVLGETRQVIGVLSTGDVVRAHQAAMRRRTLASPVSEIERARDAARREDVEHDPLAEGAEGAEGAEEAERTS